MHAGDNFENLSLFYKIMKILGQSFSKLKTIHPRDQTWNTTLQEWATLHFHALFIPISLILRHSVKVAVLIIKKGISSMSRMRKKRFGYLQLKTSFCMSIVVILYFLHFRFIVTGKPDHCIYLK